MRRISSGDFLLEEGGWWWDDDGGGGGFGFLVDVWDRDLEEELVCVRDDAFGL